MKTKELVNADYGIYRVSDVMKDSDWPVYFVIRIMYTGYYDSEWEKQVGKYHVEIHATSMECLKQDNPDAIKSCSACMGIDITELDAKHQAIELVEYGTSAMLWQTDGNNLRNISKQANKELQSICMLFGFYMDRHLNMIGASGWDFIRGDFTKRLPEKVDE